MRKILITFITLCIFYFVGGYFAVRYGKFSENTFIIYASILGGLASVTGLLSLVRPSITRTDIQELEVDSLKRISKAAEELEKYKNERSVAQQELAKLELQKEEMEFLVKKASLSLFLKDQLKTVHRSIIFMLDENKELSKSIEEYGRLVEKLVALEEEIEKDKNVDILREILKSAVEYKLTFERPYDPNDPFSILNDLWRSLREFFGIERA